MAQGGCESIAAASRPCNLQSSAGDASHIIEVDAVTAGTADESTGLILVVTAADTRCTLRIQAEGIVGMLQVFPTQTGNPLTAGHQPTFCNTAWAG
jgi:hypothetical protein